MRVETKEVLFQPVTIVLESQFEVDVLRELCGSIKGIGDVRNFTSDLFIALSEHTKDQTVVDEYFVGHVEVKVK